MPFSSCVPSMLHVYCVCFAFILTEYFQVHINFSSFQCLRSPGFPQSEGHTTKQGTRRLTAFLSNSHAGGAKPHLSCCVSDKKTLGRSGWSSSYSSASHPWPRTAVTMVTIAPCSMEATGHNCRCHHQQTHALLPSPNALTQQHRSHSPATTHQKQSLRLRSKVDASQELLSPNLYQTENKHWKYGGCLFHLMEENPSDAPQHTT